MHKLMHKLSKFIFLLFKCVLRNTWSPKYLCIYICIYSPKNAFKLICNINMFLFSSECQDAQGRGNQRASYEDPRPSPILEDHLPHQHLQHARGLPTPYPPQTKRSPEERSMAGGGGGQGGDCGQGRVCSQGSSSHGSTAMKTRTLIFPSFPFLAKTR